MIRSSTGPRNSTLTEVSGLETTNVCVVILGKRVADCETEMTVGCAARTPLEALTDSVADPIFEDRRRACLNAALLYKWR
jgi:hypothetical protein